MTSEPSRPDESPGDRFATTPISRLIGFDVLPGQAGEATVRLPVGRDHHNSMGRVHGGAIAALADAAMGIAFGRTLDEGQDFATIEIKVSFMRPLRKGVLEARAKVVQRGLRLGFVQCQIADGRGRLVATASCTCTVESL